MTRKENLIALRDAVVGGDADADIFRDIWRHEKVFTMHTAIGIKRACFNGDMNAALAFVAEVLPGWATEMTYRPFGVKPHQWFVAMTTDHTGWGNGKRVAGHANTPARALLIAALNALIEETGE